MLRPNTKAVGATAGDDVHEKCELAFAQRRS
jgi:hypothetical protein